MLDIIVRGGTVVDGTGRAGVPADVGVEDGKIAAIGNLAQASAARELDATGLIVAPGFIDIHSHSDLTLLIDPRAQSQIAQGVTTELIGNCGHGCAPILDPKAVAGNIYGYDPDLPITWQTMAGYLERLEQARPATNVLTLVPNGNLRIAAMGLADRASTPDEVRQMGRLLVQGLEEGAVGFSVGLESACERAATPEEITELCRITARYDGLYAPHLRNREVRAIEAIDEALQHTADSGVRLHIPHLTPRRGGPPDPEVRAIERIDRALADGLDLSVDMHTRLYGTCNISMALPSWAYEGGPEALRARLQDPATRAKIMQHESLITSMVLGGWEYITVATSAKRPDLIGKSFKEIAEAARTTPFDALLDLLLEEVEDVDAPYCLCESYTEAQLRRTYEHPVCGVGSDATALCVDGPLAGKTFHGAYTWASWFIRRWVREERAFPIEQAVQKITDLPAQRLKLSDRGVLKPGAWADVAVFDPALFGERGTVREPNQLAVGMVHVLVNGTVAMAGGQFTPDRAGRVLRR
ncbi:MAG: D-aminoacylase [Chloroflexi bacterium]|nr:D-aminoacylase [Chloroflexota bacterium]